MKKCVFVLEDNDDLRELFTYLLEEEQYEVKSYPNAASFMASIKNEHPDIVIMDVMLPDGNGMDICDEMKKDPETKNIPIIIMSAHKDLAELKQGCKAEDVIEKPFDINHFLSSVEKYAS